MSIGSAQDRFQEIRDETPKQFCYRLMPHLKIKKKINKWYVLFEETENNPFVPLNTNYNNLWLDAMSKILTKKQETMKRPELIARLKLNKHRCNQYSAFNDDCHKVLDDAIEALENGLDQEEADDQYDSEIWEYFDVLSGNTEIEDILYPEVKNLDDEVAPE